MKLLHVTRAAALVLAAIFTLSSPAPASAASAASVPPTTEPSVSWSVRPGDASGPDGRSWVEWQGDPGEHRTEHLVVDNLGDESVEFRLTAADGYFTDTGRFNMLPSDRTSTDAGTWITLPESVSVPPNGSAIVPFDIDVPKDATPGDHPAGVAASITSPGTGTVGVESRVGFRVMTRVSGALETEISVTADGSFAGSANPFQAGDLTVSYQVTNTGNTRIRTQPLISIDGPFGMVARDRKGEEIVDIAPGETRSGTVQVSAAWPLGWYDVRVEALPTAVTEDMAAVDATSVAASTSVAALPWSQAGAVLAAALLVFWYFWQRRRSAAKTAQLVENARTEGRGEVNTDPSPRLTRRRSALPPALLLIGLLLGAGVATGVIGVGNSNAYADTDDPQGVELRVDISPAATPRPSPPHSPSPTPTAPPIVGLPATGGGVDVALVLLGGALLVGGAITTARIHRRAR